MLTRILLFGIAALAAMGAWRLARWYWRPRLVLPGDVRLVRRAGGIDVWLDIRNEGASRSRDCRAILIRCERREAFGWLRIDAPARPGDDIALAEEGRGDPGAGVSCIPARGSARIRLDRRIPDVPGSYRLDIAALNGEEKRSSYVVEVDAVPDDGPERAEGGGREGT